MQLRLVNFKMNLKIISETENPLFNRKEIVGEISAEITPSNNDVLKMLSEHFKVESETIKIKYIKGSFGVKVFKLVANIYSTKQELDETETKSKKQREADKKSREEEFKKIVEEKKIQKEAESKPEEVKVEEEKIEAPVEEVKEKNKKEVKE